jgi:sugar/nucleoside kinase (ribokinase family)
MKRAKGPSRVRSFCNLEESLEYGNAVPALSTTRAGGTEALRDRQHRESFLQTSASLRKGGNS